jgi:hypothetical protein
MPSWVFSNDLPEITHLESLTASRALLKPVGFGLGDAVSIDARLRNRIIPQALAGFRRGMIGGSGLT